MRDLGLKDGVEHRDGLTYRRVLMNEIDIAIFLDVVFEGLSNSHHLPAWHWQCEVILQVIPLTRGRE